MHYLLLIHVLLAIWILIDGHIRKLSIIPWVIGATILGPIVLPYYIVNRSQKVYASQRNGKSQILFKCIAAFWAFLLAVTGIWGAKAPTNIIKREPLEYRLAVISTGGNVRENDDIIARFHSLLDELSQNYVEDSQQIANMSVIVRDQIKANGIDESLLNIMEGINQLLWPQDSTKKRYSECVFAYVGLRKKGLSHMEAIEKLQATVSGY
jgi:hypothetical protein